MIMITALLPKVDVSKTQPELQPIVPLSHSLNLPHNTFTFPLRTLTFDNIQMFRCSTFWVWWLYIVNFCYIEHWSSLPSVSSQGILFFSSSMPLKRKVELTGSSGKRQRWADLAPRNTLQIRSACLSKDLWLFKLNFKFIKAPNTLITVGHKALLAFGKHLKQFRTAMLRK